MRKIKYHEMKNKDNYLCGFLYSKSMANFEAFCWKFSSSINILFLKSVWSSSVKMFNILYRGIYFHQKLKLFHDVLWNFQNFSEILNFKMLKGVKFLEILAENSGFSVFLSIFSQVFCVFGLNIHVFQEKSSGHTNQKSKLFRKMGEISKLFPDNYRERNGNIHPWYHYLLICITISWYQLPEVRTRPCFVFYTAVPFRPHYALSKLE